jgi:hypothetical protein
MYRTLPGIAKSGKRNAQDSNCGIKKDISSSNYAIDSKSTPNYALTVCGIHERIGTNI